MISGIGFQEILIVLVVALLIFGPRRLPELARHLGRLTRELRQLAWEFRSALELETFEHERKVQREEDSETDE